MENPIIVKEPLVTAEGRLCRNCNTRKPDDAFWRDARSKSRRSWRCKDCARSAHRKWTSDNREHVRDVARGSSRRIRYANPELARQANRRARLKKKYGLTPADVDAMLVRQNGLCGICRKPIVITHDRVDASAAHVDHDHQTGKIRDLLCSLCNTALGKFKDSVALLQSAIDYLRRHG